MKRRRFDTTEEIHAETKDVIDTFTFENLQGCMKSWETRWDSCIQAQGDYLKETVENRIYGKKLSFMVKFPEFLGRPTYFSIHDSYNFAINQQCVPSAVGPVLVNKSSVIFTQHVQYLANAASKSVPSYCGKTHHRNVQLIFMELAVNLLVYYAMCSLIHSVR